jgi:hypothetical protein
MIAGFLLRDESAELTRSLEVVLHERLHFEEAHITQAALSGRRETDADGYWSVDVRGSAEEIIQALQRAGFGESDQTDTEYFKSVVRDELNTEDIVSYRAFEASLVLGSGTICEEMPCTVVILLAPERSKAFVAIWRI